MLISEMEALLKSLDRRFEGLDRRVEGLDHRVENLDQRVGRIEQILPTLAAKADLERYATKDELRDEIRGVKVLIEDVIGRIAVVHERIDAASAGMNRRFDDLEGQLAQVLSRLERR